ncbi:MAG TPA: hypothetical protein VKE88_00975 [Candidatus Nanoarchaeia archaeon]|nr:hypothetical protein [Candidatus Nanoarchaeia archaeon]
MKLTLKQEHEAQEFREHLIRDVLPREFKHLHDKYNNARKHGQIAKARAFRDRIDTLDRHYSKLQKFSAEKLYHKKKKIMRMIEHDFEGDVHEERDLKKGLAFITILLFAFLLASDISDMAFLTIAIVVLAIYFAVSFFKPKEPQLEFSPA